MMNQTLEHCVKQVDIQNHIERPGSTFFAVRTVLEYQHTISAAKNRHENQWADKKSLLESIVERKADYSDQHLRAAKVLSAASEHNGPTELYASGLQWRIRTSHCY